MSFPLVGNLKIKSALLNAIKEKRLPHAILIEGESGTGKHTLASFIALAAVCSDENSPCEKCNNCRLAKSQNHPDISVISLLDGKKNIAVSQIRDLKAETFVKPHTASRKVFIIDHADTMNPQSQNALLKVLEEPETDVVFILIAESKSSLLETVISRCVVLTLNVPPQNDACEYISSVTNFSQDDILPALENSKNNIGKALTILSGKKTSKSQIAVKDFLDSFKNRDSWSMLLATNPLEKSRNDTADFFKNLKLEIVSELRLNLNKSSARSFSELYSCVCELEKALDSNINLNLLFCNLANRAKNLK